MFMGRLTAVGRVRDVALGLVPLASQKQRSRSEVYAAAVDEYLTRHARHEVIDTMNLVCAVHRP